MPKGPAGGPRPLANADARINFSILTTQELSNTALTADLTNIAKQAIVGAVGDDRVDAGIVSSSGGQYAPASNNLHIKTYFNEFHLSIYMILKFVRDYHTTLTNVVGTRENMSLNTQTLDDLPPNEDTFILIDQGGLEEQVFVQVD